MSTFNPAKKQKNKIYDEGTITPNSSQNHQSNTHPKMTLEKAH